MGQKGHLKADIEVQKRHLDYDDIDLDLDDWRQVGPTSATNQPQPMWADF